MESMKKISLVFVGLFILAAFCAGQQTKPEQASSKWEKWSWLLGPWKGEGSGKPGEGVGTFAFSIDLGGSVILRHGHTDFPAAQGRPASSHDDLMVIYNDPVTGDPKAIYFDNEGHTINYAVSWVDKSIVLTSQKTGNIPAFRITYTPLESGEMETVFDISQDGKTFVTYLEGKSKRAR